MMKKFFINYHLRILFIVIAILCVFSSLGVNKKT